jgi:hypothetical protein
MVKGKTSTGFEFEVDKEQLTNAEFLENFAEMQGGGDIAATFALIKITLGEKQKKNLYDHCRNKKGMVPIEALTAELSDIFLTLSGSAETKN